MTRYRIEIEVDVEGDLLLKDIIAELQPIANRFPNAQASITSCHLCPQCRQWHSENRGNLTYVRDHDMWCSVCRTIVSGTPGEPQRGLFTSGRLQPEGSNGE